MCAAPFVKRHMVMSSVSSDHPVPQQSARGSWPQAAREVQDVCLTRFLRMIAPVPLCLAAGWQPQGMTGQGQGTSPARRRVRLPRDSRSCPPYREPAWICHRIGGHPSERQEHRMDSSSLDARNSKRATRTVRHRRKVTHEERNVDQCSSTRGMPYRGR